MQRQSTKRNSYQKHTNKRKFILSVLAFTFIVMIFAILMYNRHQQTNRTSLEGKLSNNALLSEAKLLYHNQPSIFGFSPGNDSALLSVYRLSPSAIRSLLNTEPLLAACLETPQTCQESPSWKKRNELVKPSASTTARRSIGDNETLKLYEAISENEETLCTAHNLSSEQAISSSSIEMVCISTTLNVVTYEYISNHDR